MVRILSGSHHFVSVRRACIIAICYDNCGTILAFAYVIARVCMGAHVYFKGIKFPGDLISRIGISELFYYVFDCLIVALVALDLITPLPTIQIFIMR